MLSGLWEVKLEMCRCDTDAPAGIAKLEYGTCYKLPNTKIHKCKVHYIAENNSNRTISELDVCILVTHYWNFSKSKGHNSAENYWTGPKFKLKLHILVINLYTEFQFKMSICNGDNERKLKINGIFLSSRGITLPKIIGPDPNSNSTCVFSWQTYVLYFIWISPCMTEIMSGNCEKLT